MLTCPRCGGELEADDDRCVHCGHVLAVSPASVPGAPEPAPAARRIVAGVGCGMLALMVALIAIVALFSLLLGGLVGTAPATWI